MRVYFHLAACAVAAAVCAHFPVAAQDVAASYPSKPVRVVIPYPPGGSTDTEARLYNDKLQASLGQPFIFDYRPGAASTIGVAYTMKAAPDGYTIMMAGSTLTVLPNFYPELNHAVVSTLIPVIELSNRGTGVLVSPAALPNVHTLRDLVNYGKTNPGKLNCVTSGPGGISHIVCAALSNALHIPITPVHYKGAGQSVVDLIAGRVQLHAITLFVPISHIRAGKLRTIATLGHERSALLPDVTTSFEQGFNVDYPNWLGLFAPPRTPQAIVEKLNAELVKAIRSPDVAKAMEAQGLTPIARSSDAFRKKIASELTYWKKIVEDNNIQASE